MGISYSDSLDSVPLSYLRLEDMNASSGGVARDTYISTSSYTTVYSYTGSGYLLSFLITLEGNLLGADPFLIKLVADNVTVFELNTLDIATAALWNLGADLDETNMGVSVANNTFRFHVGTIPARFSSNISVSIKKASGSNKRFRAGMIRLTRET